MVSDKTMSIILAYSIPYIAENLKSLDFLSSHAKKIDGKIPFFDDETPRMQVSARRGKMPHVRTRPSIHLKDSWRIDVSAKGGLGYVYLSNSKRSSDNRWVIADLLWFGTHPYQIDVPTVYKEVVVSAIPGVGQTQFPSLKQWRKYRAPEPAQRGHLTGRMTFFNRYTGHWNYNRTFRRGIRNEIVTSFKEYILLCVENGIRRGIEMMTNEGILKVNIKDVHVKALS